MLQRNIIFSLTVIIAITIDKIVSDKYEQLKQMDVKQSFKTFNLFNQMKASIAVKCIGIWGKMERCINQFWT